jgi:hypothetical protein
MRPRESDPLVKLVSDALDIENDTDFNAWNNKAIALANLERGGLERPPEWQQFVIRVCDERGDGVADWTISLQIKWKNKPDYEPIAIDDFHPYEKDKSFRCLHINLTESRLSSLDESEIHNVKFFGMKLMMNSGSDYLLYVAQREDSTKSSAKLFKGLSELTVLLEENLYSADGRFSLIMPYTTTYVEFRVNRDPSLDGKGKAKLCHTK